MEMLESKVMYYVTYGGTWTSRESVNTNIPLVCMQFSSNQYLFGCLIWEWLFCYVHYKLLGALCLVPIIYLLCHLMDISTWSLFQFQLVFPFRHSNKLSFSLFPVSTKWIFSPINSCYFSLILKLFLQCLSVFLVSSHYKLWLFHAVSMSSPLRWYLLSSKLIYKILILLNPWSSFLDFVCQ